MKNEQIQSLHTRRVNPGDSQPEDPASAVVPFRRKNHLAVIDPVSHDAQSIASATESLLTVARAITTVDDALRMYHLTAGMRDALDYVAAVALSRADMISIAKE